MSNGLTIDELRELTGGVVGITDVACPVCGPGRKTPSNRIRKVMRVWDEGGDFVTYHCERCGESGYAKEKSGGTTVKKQPRPAPAPAAAKVDDKSDLARDLWMRSANAKGTLVETYLRSRHCWIESENIRYLPGRGNHGPTMIARFGSGSSLTGVHLTRLAPDGRGKAGTEKDKIMLGPSKGQPIMVHDSERGELIVAEGIEDAASWAIATGWSAWAAGSAGRIPHVLANAGLYDRVYLSLDCDDAGEKAMANALAARSDLIVVDVAKMMANGLDANKVMIKHGSKMLIELLLKAQRGHGRLSWRQLQRELNCG